MFYPGRHLLWSQWRLPSHVVLVIHPDSWTPQKLRFSRGPRILSISPVGSQSDGLQLRRPGLRMFETGPVQRMGEGSKVTRVDTLPVGKVSRVYSCFTLLHESRESFQFLCLLHSSFVSGKGKKQTTYLQSDYGWSFRQHF